MRDPRRDSDDPAPLPHDDSPLTRGDLEAWHRRIRDERREEMIPIVAALGELVNEMRATREYRKHREARDDAVRSETKSERRMYAARLDAEIARLDAEVVRLDGVVTSKQTRLKQLSEIEAIEVANDAKALEPVAATIDGRRKHLVALITIIGTIVAALSGLVGACINSRTGSNH